MGLKHSKNNKISLFFRKKNPNFHSIENVFTNILPYLKEEFEVKCVDLPFHKGFVGRLINVFYAFFSKNYINHITGDVNYIALSLPKKSLIITLHDIESALSNQNTLKKYIIKKFWFEIPLKRAKYITVVSEFTKKQVIENFGVDTKKIFVIPNSYNTFFESTITRNYSQKPSYILTIGTKPNKNLERIIEAISNLDVVLITIGKLSQNQIEKLENLNIKYENYYNISMEKIIKLYEKSHVLVFPSLYEGFGMPIIEAQANNLPVITSDLQPLKTTAGDGALFVNPFDTNEIKAAINTILENEIIRTKIIEKGKENIKKYHPATIARFYKDLYKKI